MTTRDPVGTPPERPEVPTPWQITEYLRSFSQIADAKPGLFLMVIGVAMIVIVFAFKVFLGNLAPEEYIASVVIGFLILASGAVLHAAVLRARSRSLASAKDILDAIRGTRPLEEKAPFILDKN